MLASPPMPAPAFTLIVPGLLWPRPALDDTVRGLRLPGLERLLRLGMATRATLDESDWWRDRFALPAPLPAAALRLLDLGGEPGDLEWACLDPIHLAFGQQDATLADPATLALDATADAALFAAIAPLFAGLGTLHATAPGCWHIAPRVALPPLADMLHGGLSGRHLLPPGDAGKRWRQALNEAQMQLHTLPLNQARETAGMAPINSLALWGGGRLPARAASNFGGLLADDAVLRGLGRLAGCATAPLGDGFDAEAISGRTVVARVGTLSSATLQHDALRWREALQALEARWIAPALAATDRGELGAFALIGCGDGTALTLRYAGRDRLRFWRRPAPLTELYP